MVGRNPHERHRVATPLELLFDLTFVVAFDIAASQLAHMLADDHVRSGLEAFGFATFAICWAWINFSWFASAFDTDDWIYRVLTMLQMVGVIVLALGLPQMYTSIEHGEHVENEVMVAGYIIMRIALVAQWLRAARQDPAHRSACLTYATFVIVAQVGWVGQIVAHTSVEVFAATAALLILLEFAGPYVAETRKGGTPWHAHHIAERYGLLVIIALGEGVVGTVASISAVVGESGWSVDAALVAVAGTGLTFGMWWLYFLIPAGELLHADRRVSFPYGYLHILVFGAIVATGAGLHAAAYYIEHQSKLGSTATVLAVAIPVAIYIVGVYAIYLLLIRRADAAHALLLGLALAVLAGAIWLANSGVEMSVCLIIVMLAPFAIVVAYESVGHRRVSAAVAVRLGSP
ncbi:MAG: low temperature requirement protein A [Actinobacteria bacterium]|nr:low temperature requirement protein A [Actinomycetota bacterium]